MTTWFQQISSRLAQLILLTLLALFIATAVQPSPPPASGETQTSLRNLATDNVGMSDLRLYDRIRTRVADGESYYSVAASEHRNGSYPLKPFVTVRLPTLAWISAALGSTMMQTLLVALAVTTASVWGVCLTRQPLSERTGEWTARFVAASCGLLAGPMFLALHECWAALLICLSLGCWGRGWTRAAIAAGLMAALVREIAAPYLLLMGAMAAIEMRWREMVAWVVALGAIALVLVAHAAAVSMVVLPADVASPGWLGFGGWAFYVETIATWSLLSLLPTNLGFALVPLALLGWSAWASPLGVRVGGLLAGNAVILMVIARPDNHYWAVLTAPLIAPGLVLAAPAIWQLALRAKLTISHIKTA